MTTVEALTLLCGNLLGIGEFVLDLNGDKVVIDDPPAGVCGRDVALPPIA